MEIKTDICELRLPTANLAPLAKRNGMLHLLARDNELTIVAVGTPDDGVTAFTKIKCDVVRPGTAYMPALIASQAMSASPDAPVTVATTENGIKISGRRILFKWQTPTDAPEPMLIDVTDDLVHCDGAMLSQCLDRVEFYSKNSVHQSYALETVCVSNSGGNLYCVTVGGGGACLAAAKTPCQGADHVEPCLLPRDTVNSIKRIVKAGPCDLSLQKERLVVKCCGYLLSCSTVSGKYPNWRDMLLGFRAVDRIEIPADEIVASVRQVCCAGEFESKGMSLIQSNDTLTLSRMGATGQAVTEIPIAHQDRTATCRVNYERLIQAISRAPKGGVVRMHIPDDSPGSTEPIIVEFPGAMYYLGVMGSSVN